MATSRSRTKKPARSGTKKASSPFDIESIRALVALMDEHQLTQIQIQDGDKRLKISKQSPHAPVTVVPCDGAAPTPSATPVPNGDTWSPTAPEPETKTTSELVDIPSPMVGTFYAASAPDEDPFVTIGTHVTPDTRVCVIEAMKVFNEIQAEVEGEVVEILVENGQPVEYGQVLFRVDPTT